MNKPFWEESYKESDNTFDGGKPSKEIVRLSNHLPNNSSVLDLGCGDGRNSIFLAEQGHKVTAIDVSQNGISKLNKKADDLQLDIDAYVADAATFKFDQEYDLIIAHGVLHLIQIEKRKKLLTNIKNYTTQSGYNVIVVFTNKLPPPKDLAEFMVGLYDEGELFEEYIPISVPY